MFTFHRWYSRISIDRLCEVKTQFTLFSLFPQRDRREKRDVGNERISCVFLSQMLIVRKTRNGFLIGQRVNYFLHRRSFVKAISDTIHKNGNQTRTSLHRSQKCYFQHVCFSPKVFAIDTISVPKNELNLKYGCKKTFFFRMISGIMSKSTKHLQAIKYNWALTGIDVIHTKKTLWPIALRFFICHTISQNRCFMELDFSLEVSRFFLLHKTLLSPSFVNSTSQYGITVFTYYCI